MSNILRNIGSNYIIQSYTIIVNFIVIPFYMKYLGAEAYGLIALYTIILAWFNLLDMGFSSTITRQSIEYLSGNVSSKSFLSLFRTLEIILLFIGVIACFFCLAFSHVFFKSWFETSSLLVKEINFSISVIFLIVLIRWFSGLYKGVIIGFEFQFWLNKINFLFISIKSIGVIFLLIFIKANICIFFLWQLVFSLIELIAIVKFVYGNFPKLRMHFQVNWNELSKVLPFSGSILLNCCIGVLLTQCDKLILSRLLSLEQFGYFSLAFMLSSSIGLAVAPVSNVFLAKISKLYLEKNNIHLIALYKNFTEFVSIMALSVALPIIFFSKEILYIWMGTSYFSKEIILTLKCYAIGSLFSVLSSFPYYLQFAMGNMKWHIAGNFVILVLLLPMMIFFVDRFGVIGAGLSWGIVNILYFLIWVFVVHKRFLLCSHFRWLIQCIIKILVPMSIFSIFVFYNIDWAQDRFFLTVQFSIYMGFSFLIGVIASYSVRQFIFLKFLLLFRTIRGSNSFLAPF